MNLQFNFEIPTGARMRFKEKFKVCKRFYNVDFCIKFWLLAGFLKSLGHKFKYSPTRGQALDVEKLGNVVKWVERLKLPH